eukprot:CAMPEP_0175601848 /NCGR_PEP_ID=MMETSP0096-20121207/58335_1 /TAXON_ID=311494 /ORGANISM="Alexandrium monilatum, Strain CCMP3105" /LENGTH=42 /DNA_ID= /DNA_START= /DNA_END= /DNA_ORIENTATION=
MESREAWFIEVEGVFVDTVRARLAPSAESDSREMGSGPAQQR